MVRFLCRSDTVEVTLSFTPTNKMRMKKADRQMARPAWTKYRLPHDGAV
jgi:hypothetical protein